MFRIEDNFPESSLEEIYPISNRAQSLMARELDSTILSCPEEFIRFNGTLQMLRGMEYHYNKFMEKVRFMEELWDAVIQLNPNPLAFHTNTKEYTQEMAHDAVAYLNRLGQFYYFATSKAISKVLELKEKDRKDRGDKIIPTIAKFSFFRNKHTAHRSVDSPVSDDTEHLQYVHGASIDGPGLLWGGAKPTAEDSKNPKTVEESNRINVWRTLYLTYQIQGHPVKDGVDVLGFSPERDHAEIMNEAYGLLKKVIEASVTT
jgi:hypothetical protein